MAIDAYSQTSFEEVMSAVPDNSCFMFRIAVFLFNNVSHVLQAKWKSETSTKQFKSSSFIYVLA